MKRLVAFALAFFLLNPLNVALAQVHTQPTEIITAPPLTPFTSRTGFWPSSTTPPELITTDRQTLTDHLNSIPGVQARDYGSPTISIRGSYDSGRVVSLFDEIPLDLRDGFGTWTVLRPTEILGELDVLKGPGSVFYGSAAMGGVIVQKPRVFERPALQLGIGDDNNTFLPWEDGGLGYNSVFGVMPIITDQETNDFVQLSAFSEHYDGQFPFEIEETDIHGVRSDNNSYLHRYTMIGEQTVGKWRVGERFVYGQRIGSAPGSVDGLFPPATFNTRGGLGSLSAKRALSRSSDLSLRLTHVFVDSDFDKHLPTESHVRTMKTQGSADWTYVFANQVSSILFTDYTQSEFRATYAGDNLFHAGEFEAGQVIQIPLTKSLSLQPGYRYLAQFGEWVKSAALNAEVDTLNSWITYSEGFRSPSLSDRYSEDSYYKGNPGLQPERSAQWEAGFLKKIPLSARAGQQGWSFGGNVYRIDYTSIFDTSRIADGRRTRINAGKAQATGAETSAGFSHSIWSVTAAYNYLDARNLDRQQPLRLSPLHQATLTVSMALGFLVFELEDTYWGRYYDTDFSSDQLAKLGPWNTLDLNIRTLGLADWEIRGGILNIFDEPRQLAYSYPEPQRRFYLKALSYF